MTCEFGAWVQTIPDPSAPDLIQIEALLRLRLAQFRKAQDQPALPGPRHGHPAGLRHVFDVRRDVIVARRKPKQKPRTAAADTDDRLRILAERDLRCAEIFATPPDQLDPQRV